MITIETIPLLDRLAANTWPAQYTKPLDSWLLRATPALPSRRSSSVLTIGDFPRTPDWMEQLERYYAAYELPPRFHVSSSSPSGLDEMLAQLGYVKEMESIVMAADCETVINHTLSSEEFAYKLSLSETATPAWTAAFMAIEQFEPLRTPAYQQMMDRIEGRTLFALAHEPFSTAVVGIGTAVLEGNWAGLINIATSSSFRRQGIGLHMIGYLASLCVELGARHLYLQVLASNESAQRLYRKIGFEKVFEYHYRTCPSQYA